jgi:hypothetical protein
MAAAVGDATSCARTSVDIVAQYAGHVQTAPRQKISAATTIRRAESNISTDISQFSIRVSILDKVVEIR